MRGRELLSRSPGEALGARGTQSQRRDLLHPGRRTQDFAMTAGIQGAYKHAVPVSAAIEPPGVESSVFFASWCS
jgi:hypothetical protein